MARVYSTSFFFLHHGTSSHYFPPADKLAIVRWVTIFNSDAIVNATFHLLELTSLATILQRSVGPVTSQSEELRVVLPAGADLTIANDPTIDCTVSGYLLDLP